MRMAEVRVLGLTSAATRKTLFKICAAWDWGVCVSGDLGKLVGHQWWMSPHSCFWPQWRSKYALMRLYQAVRPLNFSLFVWQLRMRTGLRGVGASCSICMAPLQFHGIFSLSNISGRKLSGLLVPPMGDKKRTSPNWLSCAPHQWRRPRRPRKPVQRLVLPAQLVPRSYRVGFHITCVILWSSW